MPLRLFPTGCGSFVPFSIIGSGSLQLFPALCGLLQTKKVIHIEQVPFQLCSCGNEILDFLRILMTRHEMPPSQMCCGSFTDALFTTYPQSGMSLIEAIRGSPGGKEK